MANLFNVTIKPVSVNARATVKEIITRMLGPNTDVAAEQLLVNGGVVFRSLNKDAANHLVSQLSDAGAVAEAQEIAGSAVPLFRLRLLSFGESKVRVIKHVKNLTGLGLRESKDLVESLGIILDNIDHLFAEKAKLTLEGVGATVLVEALASPDTEQPDTVETPYQVTGKVTLFGDHVVGVLVRAFDKDLRSEQFLGEASTTESGKYTLFYSAEQFASAEKNNADLVLRVFNEVGQPLLLDDQDSEQEKIHFNVPKKIEINLPLLETEPVKVSEYERLQSLLNPSLDGATLAELSLQDIAFLNNETEISEFANEFPAKENSIHFISQSAKLAVETSLPAHAFYGWARLGDGIVKEEDQDTLELTTLLDKSNKELKNTLEQAVEGLIIPASLLEEIDSLLDQLQRLRDEKAQEEKSNWVQHQAKGILVDADSDEPLDGYFVRAELPEQSNLLNSEGGITNAQGEFIVTYKLPPESIASTQALFLQIETPSGEPLDKQEINVVVEQAAPITVKINVPIPPELGEGIKLAVLPMTFSGGLSSTLETNNLTNIAELRKVGDLNKLAGLPDGLQGSDELKLLQAHVDLSLLATNLEPEQQIEQSQFLIKKGFNSFDDIADMSVDRFVKTIGDAPELINPEVIYREVIAWYGWIDYRYLDTEEIEHNPALSCQCKDCVSAISPGAYLTDLIGYVTKHVTHEESGDPITLDFLVDSFHQPLSKLPINCEATKTQVRQVRIACEVLYKSLSPIKLKDSVDNEGIKQYRKNAYQALLRNLGTSHFALQRASTEEEIESIANRLGIAAEHVEALQEQDNASNHVLAEEKLEGLFGLPAFVEQANAKRLDPLRFLNKQQTPPLFYDWRLTHLQKQWAQADHPKSPLQENTPIIDPDVIGPDDFRNTDEATSPAFKLWKTRRLGLDEQVTRIHGKLSAANKLEGLNAAILEIPTATSIDDLIAQQALLTRHGKIDEGDIFDQWLKARHLSAEALTELAKIATDVKANKELTDEEWQTYTTNTTNIIVNSLKTASYGGWINEEKVNINLDINNFWPSLTEPVEGEWSGLLEIARPLIDPEKVEPKYLPDGKFGLEAHTIWEARQAKLKEINKKYLAILNSNSADRITTIMDNAFVSAPDLDDISKKLNSLEASEQAEARKSIADLNLDEDSFKSLLSASLLLEDQNETLSDTAQNNLVIALVSAHKLNVLYKAWVIEDAQTSLPYWKSLKARLPKWRASVTTRQQWQQALKQASKPPLIDPDIISGEVFLEPVVGNVSFDIWRARLKLISAQLQQISNSLVVSADNIIDKDAASNWLLENLEVTFAELIALEALENQGISISKHLQQLSLARNAYLFLLNVAKRIDKGSKVLPATRENMASILVQNWKLKQFAKWRAEEKDKLSLTPEFFKPLTQRPQLTSQQDAQKWRLDTRRQRQWHRTLKARIQQQETLLSSLKTLVSDIEEHTLPQLRNALIEIVETSNEDLHIKAEKLTKRFLISMQMSGCQTTTRVSMALELLQILVFSIRSGELEIAGKNLTLKSKSFEKEWKWMGSYATWKAAMGVFLYPEQILYPSLLRDRTPLFKEVTKSLDENISPSNICEQASKYSDYVKDLLSLQPQASCHAEVNIGAEGECDKKTSNYEERFFVFAKGKHTGSYYWSMVDENNLALNSRPYWNKIIIPDDYGTLYELFGVSPYADSEKIYFFFRAEGGELIYATFNLSENRWDSEDGKISLSIVEIPNSKIGRYNCIVQGAQRPSLIFTSGNREFPFFCFAEFDGVKWSYKPLRESETIDLVPYPLVYFRLHFASIVGISKGSESFDKVKVLSLLVSLSGTGTGAADTETWRLNFEVDDSNITFIQRLVVNKNIKGAYPICSYITKSEFASHFVTILRANSKLFKQVVRVFHRGSIRGTLRGFSRIEGVFSPSIYFAEPNSQSGSERFISYSIKGSPTNKAFIQRVQLGSKNIWIGDKKDRILISLIGQPRIAQEIIDQDNVENNNQRHFVIQRLYSLLTREIGGAGQAGYLNEAYFFLPLQIALTLHKNGQYKESLSWFRSIFDYQNVNGGKKASFLLKEENRSITSYDRENWIQDLLNPHSFQRDNKYSHFVVQNITRCLLDYADSEFTFDTSESVVKAKSLYQTALDLIQSELPLQPTNKCQALIESLTYTVKDKTLHAYFNHLKNKLGEITSTDVLKTTLAKVVEKLNTTTLPEEKRLSNALVAIEIALGERKASLTATEIIKKSSQTRQLVSRELLSGSYLASKQAVIANLVINFPNSNATDNNSAEIETVEITDFDKIEFTPRLSYEFCIPNNPTAKYLLLRTELNLFKIRNCMNIAGMHRELEPYATSIDVESALPSMGAGGQISLSGTSRIRPTQYRYPVLVDRAKQLASLAQQTEASFFNAIQSKGQEVYSIFKARQDVELSREGVKLQKLRVSESEDGVGLAELQLERTSILEKTYADWISQGMLEEERALLEAYEGIENAQNLAALAKSGSAIASLAVTASTTSWENAIVTGLAMGASLFALGMENMAQEGLHGAQKKVSVVSLNVSIALRNREYELQQQLAEQDLEIGNQQIKLANDRVYITEQEQTIAEIQSEQASDTVTFLQEKFTNVELYEWMSGVLEGIFRYYLQQGASMSKLAEIQLAFERQEPLMGVIKDNYYELPNNDGDSSSNNESSSTDRRGLTGSARLLRDITKLDQYAFRTDQRKQQLSVNFSLSQLDPYAFQQFKQTGVLNFDTSGKLFDRRFPGQYLRLIKRVRISVVALVPPVQGVSATLTASGISRAVIGGDVFRTTVIRRDPESIAFTNPIGASGVFELNPNPEMLLPFEGTGVDTRWEFSLSKASNPIDYNTIADVLLTVEYTALHNRTYQEQVQNELNNDTYTSFDRGFSFRQEFADAWYDLHNPEQTNKPMQVSFKTTLSDFPSNMQDLSISNVLMYFVTDNELPSKFEATLHFTNTEGSYGGLAAPIDGVISMNRTNGGNWALIGGKVPEGTWQLALPNTPIIKQLFADEKIKDILMVLTCEGELPKFIG